VEQVVDVGGGYGGLLTAVLQAHPHLQGVRFETPTVGAEATRRLAATDVAARCSVMDGDFFEAVPLGAIAICCSSFCTTGMMSVR